MVCQRRGDARDLNLHRSDNTDHVRNPLFRGCFQSAPIIPHKARAVDFHLLRVPIILLFLCCFYLKRFLHKGAERIGVSLLKAVLADKVRIALAEIHIEIFIRLIHAADLEIRVQVRSL